MVINTKYRAPSSSIEDSENVEDLSANESLEPLHHNKKNVEFLMKRLKNRSNGNDYAAFGASQLEGLKELYGDEIYDAEVPDDIAREILALNFENLQTFDAEGEKIVPLVTKIYEYFEATRTSKIHTQELQQEIEQDTGNSIPSILDFSKDKDTTNNESENPLTDEEKSEKLEQYINTVRDIRLVGAIESPEKLDDVIQDLTKELENSDLTAIQKDQLQNAIKNLENLKEQTDEFKILLPRIEKSLNDTLDDIEDKRFPNYVNILGENVEFETAEDAVNAVETLKEDIQDVSKTFSDHASDLLTNISALLGMGVGSLLLVPAKVGWAGMQEQFSDFGDNWEEGRTGLWALDTYLMLAIPTLVAAFYMNIYGVSKGTIGRFGKNIGGKMGISTFLYEDYGRTRPKAEDIAGSADYLEYQQRQDVLDDLRHAMEQMPDGEKKVKMQEDLINLSKYQTIKTNTFYAKAKLLAEGTGLKNFKDLDWYKTSAIMIGDNINLYIPKPPIITSGDLVKAKGIKGIIFNRLLAIHKTGELDQGIKLYTKYNESMGLRSNTDIIEGMKKYFDGTITVDEKRLVNGVGEVKNSEVDKIKAVIQTYRFSTDADENLETQKRVTDNIDNFFENVKTMPRGSTAEHIERQVYYLSRGAITDDEFTTILKNHPNTQDLMKDKNFKKFLNGKKINFRDPQKRKLALLIEQFDEKAIHMKPDQMKDFINSYITPSSRNDWIISDKKLRTNFLNKLSSADKIVISNSFDFDNDILDVGKNLISNSIVDKDYGIFDADGKMKKSNIEDIINIGNINKKMIGESELNNKDIRNFISDFETNKFAKTPTEFFNELNSRLGLNIAGDNLEDYTKNLQREVSQKVLTLPNNEIKMLLHLDTNNESNVKDLLGKYSNDINIKLQIIPKNDAIAEIDKFINRINSRQTPEQMDRLQDKFDDFIKNVDKSDPDINDKIDEFSTLHENKNIELGQQSNINSGGNNPHSNNSTTQNAPGNNPNNGPNNTTQNAPGNNPNNNINQNEIVEYNKLRNRYKTVLEGHLINLTEVENRDFDELLNDLKKISQDIDSGLIKNFNEFGIRLEEAIVDNGYDYDESRNNIRKAEIINIHNTKSKIIFNKLKDVYNTTPNAQKAAFLIKLNKELGLSKAIDLNNIDTSDVKVIGINKINIKGQEIELDTFYKGIDSLQASYRVPGASMIDNIVPRKLLSLRKIIKALP